MTLGLDLGKPGMTGLGSAVAIVIVATAVFHWILPPPMQAHITHAVNSWLHHLHSVP